MHGCPRQSVMIHSQKCWGKKCGCCYYYIHYVYESSHKDRKHICVCVCVIGSCYIQCWANWAHFALHCCSPVGFLMNCELSDVGFFIGSSDSFSLLPPLLVYVRCQSLQSADLLRVWGWTSQISHRKNTPSPTDTSLFYQLNFFHPLWGVQPQDQTS